MTTINPDGVAAFNGPIRTSLSGVRDDEITAVGRIQIRRPSLAERADQLAQALEGLEAALGATRERLEPVLQPSVPTELKVPPVPDRTEDGSWLADYLEATARRIHGICAAVATLNDRIDV